MYFDLLIALPFALAWIGIVAFLRSKKKQGVVFLAFFTTFYVYVYKVLDYTLLQYQSLLLLRYFMPNLILRGDTADESINLVPLITLTPQDLETSLLNILLMIPFGFGLPFITNHQMKQTVSLGVLFSIVIELLQLMTGFLGKMTFRVADVNDVLFNAVGVVTGYVLFVGFVRMFHRWGMSANPVLRYVAERPQVSRQPM